MVDARRGFTLRVPVPAQTSDNIWPRRRDEQEELVARTGRFDPDKMEPVVIRVGQVVNRLSEAPRRSFTGLFATRPVAIHRKEVACRELFLEHHLSRCPQGISTGAGGADRTSLKRGDHVVPIHDLSVNH